MTTFLEAVGTRQLTDPSGRMAPLAGCFTLDDLKRHEDIIKDYICLMVSVSVSFYLTNFRISICPTLMLCTSTAKWLHVISFVYLPYSPRSLLRKHPLARHQACALEFFDVKSRVHVLHRPSGAACPVREHVSSPDMPPIRQAYSPARTSR